MIQNNQTIGNKFKDFTPIHVFDCGCSIEYDGVIRCCYTHWELVYQRTVRRNHHAE